MEMVGWHGLSVGIPGKNNVKIPISSGINSDV
jgi:hypothetical protein